MNQNYYDPNLCYNFNSSSFDQYQPPQYSVTHQTPMAELLLEEKLHQALQALCEKLDKNVQEKQEEKNVAEEQAAKVSSQYWKPPIYYDDDDDDDEECSIPLRDIISELPLSVAIAPDLPITDSLIMEDEHLNTIPETESDEENESSVKDLNLTPSESEDLSDYESECDMPICDDSSSKNEGLDDIISIPPGKEIDHLDAIPDSVQSLLNRANSIIFLIEEFVGKLAPIDPIPPGIVEADFDPKEDIRLIEKLLNDNSSPHTPEELNYEIPDDTIESFSPSPIPVEDSDSLMEEIDIFLAPDDSIPPGIENDDYDSEGDVLFLEELLNDDSIFLPEYESFHFDFPSSPRPPEKPPDDDVYFDIEPDTGVLTTKVVDDISDNSTRELYVHVPNVLPTHPTLYPVFDTLLPFSSENEDKLFNPGILTSKKEKSPHFLSHRGFKAFQIIYDFSESPMMICEEDIPILDVPFLHFYPP
ncbi:hypothetical protein Tco_0677700 [Tanacetum coccineum]|uniref:Reverse transcriptase domain-containing protein n=1 Tax=Tanacetum coccineum TaxID=301880 RepID=A0ABQ4XEA1_9ASTR